MANDEFRIEVPLNMGSKNQSVEKPKKDKELVSEIKKLDKTVYGTIDVLEMLSSLLGDVFKVVQPIFKLLSILLLIIFKPLMPVVKLIAEGLAWLAKMLDGNGEGIWDTIMSWLWVALVAVGAILLIVFGGWVLWLVGLIAVIVLASWKYIKEGLVWVWDNLLKPAFSAIWEGLKWAWEGLKEGFNKIWEGLKWVWTDLLKPIFEYLWAGIKWIWTDLLKPAWDWLKDMFTSIWTDIIQPVWEWVKSKFQDMGDWLMKIVDKIKEIWNKATSLLSSAKDKVSSTISSVTSKVTSVIKGNDFILTPNGQMIQSHPKDYILATKTPEKLMNSKGNTININNPVVREDRDIKRIADEVSKVIERKLWRSY